MTGSHEVRGSIPLSSTTKAPRSAALFFCPRFLTARAPAGQAPGAPVYPASSLRAALAVASLLVGASGCEVPLDADLLEVDAVEPERLEPGVRARVAGSGFPVGRRGRMVLAGTVHSPGEPPRRVRASARVRAVSPEVVEVAVGESLVDAVGGRGTFEGDLRLEFDAAGGGGLVAGSLRGVTLDFAPGSVGRLDRELDHRREADALLDLLGITPAVGDGEAGIRVDGVRADGVAAAAGLAKGDRIVAVDGVRVGAIADVVPPPRATSVVLTVARRGEAGAVRVRVPLSGRDGGPPPAAWIAGAVFAGAWLLVLAFLAPSARLTGALARALGRPRPGRGADAEPLRPREAGPFGRRLRRGARRALFAALSVLAAALALGVLPFTARVYTGGVDVGILLFATFAARLVIGTGSAAEVALSRRRALLTRLSRFVLDGVPAAAAVGCTVILGGTVRLAGIVGAQGGAPWQWHALADPVSFVMFPVFVVAALSADGPGTDAAPAVVGVAARTQRFVMAGLGTALFLGGWNLPFVGGDPLAAEPLLRLAGAGLFIAKAGLLLAASERLRVSPRHWRWTVPVSIACTACAATTLVSPWPSEVAEVCGPTLATVAAVIAIYAVARRRRPAPPVRALPFL